MWKDPIVEEVRQARREIERECGNSFEGISARARQVQEAYKERLADRPSIQLPGSHTLTPRKR
jgi:hypothetical protein